MRDGPLANAATRARFHREAQVLAALRHPHIVTVLDQGIAADTSQYIIMDFIEGRTLGEWLRRRADQRAANGNSSPLRIFMKICSAVNAAHLRGIVHRDIKPSNILVDEHDEPFVLDFGLARPVFDSHAADSPMTLTGDFLGSLPWASPEQAEGDPDKIDTRTDVYALGVILYQLLTGGQFPYEVAGNMRDVLNNILTAAPTPPSRVMAARQAKEQQQRRIRRRVPPVVNDVIEAIVLKALSKRRDDRYQSAGELEREIANYLAGLPTIAAGQKVMKRRSRDRWVIGAAIAAMLAIVAALTSTLASRRGRHADSPGAVKSLTAALPVTPSPAAAFPLPVAPLATTMDKEGHCVVDLMPLIDGPRCRESAFGRPWQRVGNELTRKFGGVLSIPYDPPEEYDYSIEFTFTNRPSQFGQILTHDQRQFRLVLPKDPTTRPGFDVNERPYGGFLDNPQTAPKPVSISVGSRHLSLVRVRNNGVSAYLDGKLVVQYGPTYANMGSSSQHRIYNGKLGIETEGGGAETTIHKIEITEISGKGRSISPPADDPRLTWSYSAPQADRGDPEYWDVAFSTDGKYVWRTGADVTEWDRPGGRMIRHEHVDENADISCKKLSRDGHLLFWVPGHPPFGRVEELGKPARGLPMPLGNPRAVDFSPDGSRLAMVSHDRNLEIRDVASGNSVRKLDAGKGLSSVDYSPDGLHFLTCGDQCILWDARTLKQVWEAAFAEWGRVSFSPDGARVVVSVGSGDGGAIVFDAANGDTVAKYAARPTDVHHSFRAEFSPDSRVILVVETQGGPLTIIDPETGKDLYALKDPLPPVTSAAWSPDGKYVLAGCKDATMRLLDFKIGKVVQTFTGHVGPVWACNFSADGKFVASCYNDEKVRVFRVAAP